MLFISESSPIVNNLTTTVCSETGVLFILEAMETKYEVLQMLAALVQEAPQPTQYQCIPRELILRSNLDWATIYTHLVELEREELVQIVNAEGVKFSITQKGIDIAKAIQADDAPEFLLALKKVKIS